MTEQTFRYNFRHVKVTGPVSDASVPGHRQARNVCTTDGQRIDPGGLKAKKRKKPPNPTESDLPQNPEFQEFMGNLRQILSVPKADIDLIIAKERLCKEQARESPE